MFKALLAVAALLGAGLGLAADEFPVRPITFIVPAAPGGGLDSLARTMAQEMGARMGQSIIVDNRPGGGGVLAAQMVARAKPDGYTVFVTQTGPLLNMPLLSSKLPYSLKDFELVTSIGTPALVVAVGAEVPARTMKEFIAWSAKNKGKVSYGSFGVGSYGHILGAYLSDSRQLDMTHVAYKGEAPMLQDLVGGQIQWAIASIGTALPHAASGRLRILAIINDRRDPAIADVPTMVESGLSDNEFKPFGWIAVALPAGVPAAVVTRIERETRAAIQSTPMKARMQVYGIMPTGNSGAEFRRDFNAAVPVMERMIKSSKITIE